MYRFGVLLILLQILLVYGVTKDTRRIRFGETAAEKQFPYFALLDVCKSINDEGYGYCHICGSAIIRTRWLLTAAHCLADSNVTSIAAYVGSTKKQEGERYSIDLKTVELHPGFKNEFKNKMLTMYHDISVLKTINEIKFTDKIQPIKLMQEEVNPLEVVHHLGFGTNKEDLSILDNQLYVTTELMYTKRQVIEKDACKNILLKESIIFLEGQMCSLPIDNRGGAPCYGDSGGPVIYRADDEEDRRLVGIISHGNNCQLADVIVNVVAYTEYIRNITGPL